MRGTLQCLEQAFVDIVKPAVGHDQHDVAGSLVFRDKIDDVIRLLKKTGILAALFQVVHKLPVHYNIGHLVTAEGDSVSPDGNYIIGYGNDSEWGSPLESFIISLKGVAGVPNMATTASVELGPAYPNPFNPSTSIGFTLDRPGRVLLTVHDVAGRRVCTLTILDDLNICSGAPFAKLLYRRRGRFPSPGRP